MNHPQPLAVLIATLAAGLVAGCGLQRIETPTRPSQTLIVLLPDPDDGTVGRAVVSNPAGAAEFAAARESTSVSPNQPAGPVKVMSEADVQRLFGDALSALPPAALHFILYCRFESDKLTDQSRALVPEVLQAVRNRPFPDVAVVGHTDTTGKRASNVELGRRRANAIRRVLVDAGVDAAVIDVTSYGETDLLVKTEDEVLEPRNRRVEITIR
jgi:outer membrane protein OmpA-like peptidoglycan-associated protein